MAQHGAAQADFSFVHFSDTHIMAEGLFTESVEGWQVDTAASLRRVIRTITTLEPLPAFAMIGGDLTSPDLLERDRTLTPEDYEPSYRLLQDILAPLSCPIYMLMGNHDDRIAFHRVMQTGVATPDASHDYSFDHQGYHFIALDSLQPGEVGGHLEAAQLDWLRQDLQAHQGQPTLVFVHHQPWKLGLEWLDDVNLHNGEELMHLLHDYADVRWLICGHVHMDQDVQRQGLTMLTSPSTCFRFSKLSQTRKMLPGPPGFRWVRVRGDELSTRVINLYDDDRDGV